MLGEMSPTTVVNQGVQILLNRMDSNPDEFAYTYNTDAKQPPKTRWDWVMDAVEIRARKHREGYQGIDKPFPFLTDYEVELLYDKFSRLQGVSFTNSVLRELLRD
jgi:uncharacterized protein YmfQ (DUF2313 family)